MPSLPVQHCRASQSEEQQAHGHCSLLGPAAASAWCLSWGWRRTRCLLWGQVNWSLFEKPCCWTWTLRIIIRQLCSFLGCVLGYSWLNQQSWGCLMTCSEQVRLSKYFKSGFVLVFSCVSLRLTFKMLRLHSSI